MKELNFFMRYFRETFALLPTQEKLGLGFPHTKGCNRSVPLVASSEIEMVSIGEPRVGSLGVLSYFLRCDECNTKREFRKS